MLIPHRQLSATALRGLIEDFVGREGTDYGAEEVPMAEKVRQVQMQLAQGTAVILFDEHSGGCNIVSRQTLKNRQPDEDGGL